MTLILMVKIFQKINYLPVMYDINKIAETMDDAPIIITNSFFENTPV